MWYLRIFVGTDVGKVRGVVTASDSVQTRLLENHSAVALELWHCYPLLLSLIMRNQLAIMTMMTVLMSTFRT